MASARVWSPNPYAIAQLLADTLDIAPILDADGEDADDFLESTLKATGTGITVTEAVELFRQIVLAVGQPMTTAQVLKLQAAKRAAQVFTVNQIERVLPYLVPLRDVEFAPFDGPAPPGGKTGQTWFGNAGQLTRDGASFDDPIQGAVSNCYLIAALSALAWVEPRAWVEHLQSSEFRPPAIDTFEWQFHGVNGRKIRAVRVSGRIPIDRSKRPRYARAKSGEAWPSLIEKAYVMKRRRNVDPRDEPRLSDYQAIERAGANPHDACQTLVGGEAVGELLDHVSDKHLLKPGSELISDAGIARVPLMAWTKDDIGIKDRNVWKKSGIWPNHAYAVLGVMPSKHIVLRNPHGVATRVRMGYATGSWHPPGRASVQLNKNGVIAMRSGLFMRYFESMGWVERL